MSINLTPFGRSLIEGSKPEAGIKLTPSVQSLIGETPSVKPKVTPEIPVKMEGRSVIGPKPSLAQNILNSPVGDILTGGMSLAEAQAMEQKAKEDFVRRNAAGGANLQAPDLGETLNFLFGPAVAGMRGIMSGILPEQGKSRPESVVKDIVSPPEAGVYGERLREVMPTPTNEWNANVQAGLAGIGATAGEIAAFNPRSMIKAITEGPQLVASRQVKNLVAEIEKELPKIKQVLKEQKPDLPPEVIDNLTAEQVYQGAATNPTLGEALKPIARRVLQKGEAKAPELPAPKPEDIKPLVAPAAEAIKQPWQMTAKEWTQEKEKLRPNAQGTGGGGFQTNIGKSKRGAENAAQKMQEGFAFLNYGIKDKNIEGLQLPPSHEDVIQKALLEGKPVPAEVLAEYPDLQPTPTPTSPKIVQPGANVEAVSPTMPEDFATAEEYVASIKELPTSFLRDKSVVTDEFGVAIRTRNNLEKYRPILTDKKYDKSIPTWESFVKDIEENGIKSPVELYVEKDGKITIVEGTHRLLAAEELGIKNVPVVIRGNTNVPNKLTAEWEAAQKKKVPDALMQKGVSEEAHDHPEIAAKHPELLPQIVKDELKLDPNAYGKPPEPPKPPTAVNPGPEEMPEFSEGGEPFIAPKVESIKTPEERLDEQAQYELIGLETNKGMHPLEYAMRDYRIAPSVLGKEKEELAEVPKRFINAKTGIPIDKLVQYLNTRGFNFENSDQLRAALKELGDRGVRGGLSPEVQQHLKNKKNIERLEQKLSQNLKSGRVRQLVNSYTGVKKQKTGALLVTTEEQFMKWVMGEREKASIGGEKAGIEIGKARAENVAANKIEKIERRAELDKLKQDIQSRDKLAATVASKENKWENLKQAIERRAELTRLKDDIIIREKYKSIDEKRAFLVDYVREKLPPNLRFKLLPEIRDVKTSNQLGDAILKIEKIADEEVARLKKIEESKRFTPEQRKELHLLGIQKGIIYETWKGNIKNKKNSILSKYKNASYEEIKEYISALSGSKENPPIIFSLYGDAKADAEAIKMIEEYSKEWKDINKIETATKDPIRIIEGVSGRSIWDEQNVLADNTINVISSADASFFDELQSKKAELADKVRLRADTKASADAMRKAEEGLPLTAEEQSSVDYVRSQNEQLIKDINAEYEKAGMRPISYRQNYLTHMREYNELMRLFKGDQDKINNLTNEQLEAIRASGFTKPNAPFNPHAQKRTGEKTKYDLVGNYEKYLETMLRIKYMLPAIRHARKFSDYALLKFPNAQYAMTQLFNELAGKPSHFDSARAWNAVISHKWLTAIRSRIAGNALVANLNFYLMNATNLATAAGELGSYALKGAKMFLSDEDMRRLAFKHSTILKSRREQFDADVKSVSMLDVNDLKGLSAIEQGKVAGKKLEYLVSSINRYIEYFNTGSTWVGAYRKAIEVFKYSPNKALKYADAIARRTQVGYRDYELPAIMRSNTGKTFLMFQSWTFNAMNHVFYDGGVVNIPKDIWFGTKKMLGHKFTEDMIKVGFTDDGTPIYAKRDSARYAMLLKLFITTAAVSAMFAYANKRKPYEFSSIVPRVPTSIEKFPVGKFAKDTALAFTSKNPETRFKHGLKAVTSTVPKMGGAQLSRWITGKGNFIERSLPQKDEAIAKRDVVNMYVDAIKSRSKGALAEADNEANKQGILIKEARKTAEERIVREIADVYEQAVLRKSKSLLKKADDMTGGSGYLKERARDQAAERILNKREKSEAMLKQTATYKKQPERSALQKAKEKLLSGRL